MNADQQLLAKTAALLILLGLLTGPLIAAATTAQISANSDMMVAAHLNALLGGFWMLGMGWTLPFCTLSEKQRRVMLYSVILANYSNWFWTVIKSFFDVHAIAITESTPNNSLFALLTGLVVLPSFLAGGLWVWGLFRKSSKETPHGL